MRSKKYAVLLLSTLLAAYSVVGGLMGPARAQEGAYPHLSVFMEVVNRIQSDYVDDPSMKAAIDGAIRGLFESLDPYGGFLRPETVNFYREYDPSKTARIGVTLSKRFGYPVVVATVPGSPAARADLQRGDTIESIGGVSARELSLIEVRSLLAGPAGQPVELTAIRRNRPEPETIRLTRKIVAVPPVETKILKDRIGYMRINALTAGKAREAKEKLQSLMQAGADQIILDLRNCAGGEQQEGVKLANLFIESGTLAYLEGQRYDRETYTADPGETVTQMPVAVLVNRGTSGPAEIVAGAIADHRRGELIGTRTYGIGSIQELLPFEDGWGLLLSVAKYYTPNGGEIEESGVNPTIEVREQEDERLALETESPSERPTTSESGGTGDRQLDKAIEVLTQPRKTVQKLV